MFIKINDRTIVNIEQVHSVTRKPNGRVILSNGTEDFSYADTDGYADYVWEYFNSIAMEPHSASQEVAEPIKTTREKVVEDDLPF